MRLPHRMFGWLRIPGTLLILTLATGALFKVAAFARESFIAAKFGLSAVTDAYFGLQQFPIAWATFMFGAFALAFPPAYAEARRRAGRVEWLPGLLFYGILIGLALTALMLVCAPFLYHTLHDAGTTDVRLTLEILAACYFPIVCIGIWAGICTADGHNLRAMTVCGVPYLIMTLALLFLYAAGWLNNLSLPLSLTIGFGSVGLYSLVRVMRSQPGIARPGSVLFVWRYPDFRHFLRQLATSSVENGAFTANQLLMLYFLAQAGTGEVSANNCAMRIGMLGYSLLVQPLAQLVQARLCSTTEDKWAPIFRRWIFLIGAAVLAFALVLLALRFPVIRLAYMHGKFNGAALNQVADLLPARLGYFVVMSANAIVAKYLFIRSQGAIYVRRQLYAYAAANLLRVAIAGSTGAAAIIWCSVASEAVALILNLRTCFADSTRSEMVPSMTSTTEAY